MTEAETLAKAYFILGLEAGVPMETIHTRWKRLAMVWHSDRFPTEDGKRDADEELKKINDARDKLKKHFGDPGHKATGPCACRTGSTQSGNTGRPDGQGPGPGKRRTTQETSREEAEAARRNEERAKRAREEATEKERQNAQKEQESQRQANVKTQEQQAMAWQEEKLRWKISVCIGIAWLALNLLGFLGMSARHTWHDISFHLEQMFHKNDPVPVQAPAPVPAPVAPQPVVQEQPPNILEGNRTLPSVDNINSPAFGGPAAPPGADIDKTTTFQNPMAPSRPPNPNPWTAPHVTPLPTVYPTNSDGLKVP